MEAPLLPLFLSQHLSSASSMVAQLHHPLRDPLDLLPSCCSALPQQQHSTYVSGELSVSTSTSYAVRLALVKVWWPLPMPFDLPLAKSTAWMPFQGLDSSAPTSSCDPADELERWILVHTEQPVFEAAYPPPSFLQRCYVQVRRHTPTSWRSTVSCFARLHPRHLLLSHRCWTWKHGQLRSMSCATLLSFLWPPALLMLLQRVGGEPRKRGWSAA